MYARENVTWMVPEEQVISYFCLAGHGFDNLINAGWTDEQIKIKILTVTAWFVQNPAFTLKGRSITPENQSCCIGGHLWGISQIKQFGLIN